MRVRCTGCDTREGTHHLCSIWAKNAELYIIMRRYKDKMKKVLFGKNNQVCGRKVFFRNVNLKNTRAWEIFQVKGIKRDTTTKWDT